MKNVEELKKRISRNKRQRNPERATVTLYFEGEERDKLIRAADELNISLRAVVALAVEEFFKNNEV